MNGANTSKHLAVAGLAAALGAGLLPLSSGITPAVASDTAVAAAQAPAAPAPGKRCRREGKTKVTAAGTFRCTKRRKKLRWVLVPTTQYTYRAWLDSNQAQARLSVYWLEPPASGTAETYMGAGPFSTTFTGPPSGRFFLRAEDTTIGQLPDWREATLTCEIYRDGQIMIRRTSTGGGVRTVDCTITQ